MTWSTPSLAGYHTRNVTLSVHLAGASALRWRQVWEVYYQDNDWSNELLFVNTHGEFRWVLNGRFYAPVESQWKEYSTQQLPVGGEWFLLETYIRSGLEDGRIVVKINEETIFDVGGPSHPTVRRDGQQPSALCLFKMYTNTFGQEQWMDDLQILATAVE